MPTGPCSWRTDVEPVNRPPRVLKIITLDVAFCTTLSRTASNGPGLNERVASTIVMPIQPPVGALVGT